MESFYTAGNMEWPHLIDNSLKAHHLYKRDVNYVVEQGTVIIVDEFTGRKMEGRQWSDGLHQAVEAKEGVTIKAETQTLATITLQNYFKLYKKLGGMTGTAMTEADEFWKIYKLDVVTIPTNRPLRRVNHPDVIFRTEHEKWNAVVDEIREVHETGRPILVGTVSIEKSEMLSEQIGKYGIKHNVLNAKYHEREAEIIAQAGREAAVTIATNMAGRGTDIILGGNPEYLAWDQLRHHYASRLDVPKVGLGRAHRQDRQGRRDGRRGATGRRGRRTARDRHRTSRGPPHRPAAPRTQRTPGRSRFQPVLPVARRRPDADLRRRMGQEHAHPPGHAGRRGDRKPHGDPQHRGAQKKVEERHFDMRKHLLEYDEVMDEQRKQVYSYRQRILDGGNCRQLILDMIDKQIAPGSLASSTPNYRWERSRAGPRTRLGLEVEARSIEGMDRARLEEYLRRRGGAAGRGRHRREDRRGPSARRSRTSPSGTGCALSRWANVRYGLNTNDRELKKIGRDELPAT